MRKTNNYSVSSASKSLISAPFVHISQLIQRRSGNEYNIWHEFGCLYHFKALQGRKSNWVKHTSLIAQKDKYCITCGLQSITHILPDLMIARMESNLVPYKWS